MSNYHRSTAYANRKRNLLNKQQRKALLMEQLGWLAAFVLAFGTYILVTAAY